MSDDDDKSWFDAHKDFDLWPNTSETTKTATSVTNQQTFVMLLISTINPQTNIWNQIFISANVKHNYGTFEADYITVYYWISFPSVHVQ